MAPSSTWVTTVIIAAELAVGGVWDILRIGYVREILEQQLGYPAYFSVIMGAWKVPGSRSGPTLARSSPIQERPSPTWRWVMSHSRWARSSSPSSRLPPGLCVRRLAATSRPAKAPGFSPDHSQAGRTPRGQGTAGRARSQWDALEGHADLQLVPAGRARRGMDWGGVRADT